jgi:site-specific DNA-methyltransferase (adenine-specific)
VTPYYSHAGIEIYHGDCREVMPGLASGMVVITDQPYGTGWVRGGGKVGEFKAKHEKPAWDVFGLDWLGIVNAPKRIAAFCPVGKTEEAAAALSAPAILHYLKTNVRPGGIAREPIVVSPPPERGPYKMAAYNGDCPLHPCQKPGEIMTWIVGVASDPGDTILDPFMGSGTTLVAAKQLGRKAIGIEIEERYCEISARRLAQEVLPL